MSLDDQFNKSDGSAIAILDNALFKFNKKIATTWQEKTHRNKSDLEKGLYLGSSIALGTYVANTGEFIMAYPALASASKGIFEALRIKSTKEEEIMWESKGLPKNTMKYLNVSLYGLSLGQSLIGATQLAMGITSGSPELYHNALNNLTNGLGVLSWISADYMSKSDIGTPPPKKTKETYFGKS